MNKYWKFIPMTTSSIWSLASTHSIDDHRVCLGATSDDPAIDLDDDEYLHPHSMSEIGTQKTKIDIACDNQYGRHLEATSMLTLKIRKSDLVHLWWQKMKRRMRCG